MAGLNLLSILGGIGGGLQQAPQAAEQAQQLKLQQQDYALRAQQMEEARMAQAMQRISVFTTLGTQIPTMQSNPGYQQAFAKALSDIGVDAEALPKDAGGNLDLTGMGSAQLFKLLQNPQNHKIVAGTPQGEARDALYNSWGQAGKAPAFMQAIPYTPVPPAGLSSALTAVMKGVQAGGDPSSAIGQLQTLYDAGSFGQNPEALKDAIATVIQTAGTPQAQLAWATDQKKFEKLVADTANAVTKGEVDQATLAHIKAQTQLVEAQTVTEKGKPKLQASEIVRNLASANAASASAERSAAETVNVNLRSNQLLTQMEFNRAHGIPVNPSELRALEGISASLSNQVKQWDGVKAATLKDMHALQTAINENTDSSRTPAPLGSGQKWLPNADDQKAMAVLKARYDNANQQLFVAKQRQQNAGNLTALPQGARPFSGTPEKYHVGETHTFKSGRFRKIRDGADTDPTNWMRVSGGE